jgi:zinc protease
VIGWAEEVRRIDRVSAQDFYDHHYAPNNAILVIAGDVTPDEIRRMAQDAYGKVPARELQPRAEPAEPPRMAETRMTITRADARVPIFSRLYRVPSYSTGRPGVAEGLETYAQLLGGDQTSILYRVLVEQKKLATDAGAGYDGFARDAGEFSVYAVPRAGVSLEQLEKAVDQVLGGMMAAPPQAADLARAKTGLVASVIYRRDSQYSLASAYGQALAIGLTVDDVNEWPARIRAVTAADVQRASHLLNRREAVSAYLQPGGGK